MSLSPELALALLDPTEAKPTATYDPETRTATITVGTRQWTVSAALLAGIGHRMSLDPGITKAVDEAERHLEEIAEMDEEAASIAATAAWTPEKEGLVEHPAGSGRWTFNGATPGWVVVAAHEPGTTSRTLSFHLPGQERAAPGRGGTHRPGGWLRSDPANQRPAVPDLRGTALRGALCAPGQAPLGPQGDGEPDRSVS